MSSIKTKIAALIAKAKGTDNEHEAAAFMSKAQEMLEKHQLDMWELHEDDPMGHQFFGKARKIINIAERRLLDALAKLYGCRTIHTWVKDKDDPDFGKKILDVVGRESSRVTTELMWPFVMDQVRKLAVQFNADNNNRIGPVRAKNHIMLALSSRIFEMIKDQKRDDPAAKNALVIVDEVKDYFSSLYPVIRKGKKTAFFTAAEGYANQVSLNRQTTNGGGVRQLA